MEKKIKYLIVEDEEKSRELLLKKIRMCSLAGIICIGMAANATEALLLARINPPDFLLLDINLPGTNGFELIDEFQREGLFPEIIFTSAHTETDILLNALKHSPITYLVKPIDLDELEEAIRKVCNLITTNNKESDIPGKIIINGNLGPVYISPEELLIVKAEAHYSRLFFENGKELLVRKGISEIFRTNLLPFSKIFIRPDRSTILNINKIVSIHTKTNECIISKGNEGITVTISANGLKLVLKAMASFGQG